MQFASHPPRSVRRQRALLPAALLACGIASTLVSGAGSPANAQMASAPHSGVTATGLLATDQVDKLLPPSVYFSGQTAPLQLRNSAAFRNAAGRTVWAALVDTSGYSTGIREKYQFYFVTEFPLTAGTLTIAPGIYGGGFLADNTFVLLDVSGAEIGRAAVTVDNALRRPRPLQMTQDKGALRLYVGRQFLPLTLR